MLLTVVAGATAALSVACSSSTTSSGFVTNQEGLIDAGSDAPICGVDGICGSLDATAGDSGFVCNGSCVYPDSGVTGTDAGLPDDASVFDGPVGLFANDSGGDGGADQ
jgi:hypothetical protein